jgi:hypothetical protein
MMDTARYGWGGATIEGDRVKWGLRSMGRSPLQPTIVTSLTWRAAVIFTVVAVFVTAKVRAG